MRKKVPGSHNRRTFLKQATRVAVISSICGPVCLTAQTTDPPKQPENENAPQAKPPIVRPDSAKQLASFGVKELKVDSERAEKEYAELIQLIPTDERISFTPLEGKNAYPELKKIVPKLTSELDYFPDSGTKFDEQANQSAIPWPDEAFFADVKKYIAKNTPAVEKCVQIINESGHSAEDTTRELHYLHGFGSVDDVQTYRQLFYSLQHQSYYHSRLEEWSKSYDIFSAMQRLLKNVEPSVNSLVQYMIHKALWGILIAAIDRICQHPRISDEWLTKYATLFALAPDFQRIFVRAFAGDTQLGTISFIAGIPILEKRSDQYLALHRLALVDSKFPANEKIEFYHLLFGEKAKSRFETELAFSKVVEQKLAEHKNVFDKAATIKELWQIVKGMTDRFSKSKNIYLDSILWESSDEFQDIQAVRESSLSTVMGLNEFAEIIYKKKPEPIAKKKDKALIWERVKKQFNPLGKFVILDFLDGYQTNNMYRPNTEELLQVGSLLIALKLYERKHGKRPQKLDELVSEKLISEEFKNPYTGKPWAYLPERGIIWRTGKDGTEFGEPPRQDEPNPQFRLSDEENERQVGIYRLLPK